MRVRAILPDGPVAEQAIAATGNRLQHAPVRTKCLADGRDMDPDRGIFDDGDARPCGPHEVVLCDDVAIRSDQRLNNLEGAAADWNGRTIGAQLTRREIDGPFGGFKDVLFSRNHGNDRSGFLALVHR